MKPIDAIRELRKRPNWKPDDCVDFVCEYLTLVWGRKVDYPIHEDDLTAAAVTRFFNRKPKRKGGYGDIVLHDRGLGINLGYRAMVYFMEENHQVLRASIPRRALFWSIA